jgi:hypothetical protein
MRLLTTFLLFPLLPLFAETSDEKDAVAASRKIFDAIAAHDPAMIRSAMLPDARVYYVRDESARPAFRSKKWRAGSPRQKASVWSGSPALRAY